MKNLNHPSSAILTLLAFLAAGISAVAQQSVVPSEASRPASVLIGEHRKVVGTITDRSGDALTLRLPNSQSFPVKLGSFTQVREKKSNPFRRARKYDATQIVAGLPVEVEGRSDSNGMFLAEKITVTHDDLKTAQSIDARVAPVERTK